MDRPGLVGGGGDGEGEGEVEAGGAGGGDGATVHGYGVANDRQAQAGASGGAAAAVVYAVEALENVGQVLGGDSLAIVPEPEIAVGVGGDVQLSGAAVGNGVVDKVLEDRCQQMAVAADGERRHFGDDAHRGAGLSLLHDFPDKRGEVDVAAVYHTATVLHTGDCGHIFQQVAEPLSVLTDTVEQFALLLRRDVGMVVEQIERKENRRHGRFQFVVDIVGELLFQAGLVLLQAQSRAVLLIALRIKPHDVGGDASQLIVRKRVFAVNLLPFSG